MNGTPLRVALYDAFRGYLLPWEQKPPEHALTEDDVTVILESLSQGWMEGDDAAQVRGALAITRVLQLAPEIDIHETNGGYLHITVKGYMDVPMNAEVSVMYVPPRNEIVIDTLLLEGGEEILPERNIIEID